MRIGVPRESKDQEARAGMTPAGVRELVAQGHQVLVEAGLGNRIGMPDADYAAAGARVLDSAQAVFAQAELVVKVKEPQPHERGWLRRGQLLFAYLHLAPDPAQAEALLASGAVAIAYETVTGPGHALPLLAPMSEIAGRMAVQVGASLLELPHGGRGVLLGGVPGVERGQVVVLGAGTAGRNAVQMAVGLGAGVTVIDRDLAKLPSSTPATATASPRARPARRRSSRRCSRPTLAIGAVLVPAPPRRGWWTAPPWRA